MFFGLEKGRERGKIGCIIRFSSRRRSFEPHPPTSISSFFSSLNHCIIKLLESRILKDTSRRKPTLPKPTLHLCSSLRNFLSFSVECGVDREEDIEHQRQDEFEQRKRINATFSSRISRSQSNHSSSSCDWQSDCNFFSLPQSDQSRMAISFETVGRSIH